MRPVPVTAQINWTNEKLVANQTTTKQKCETVSKCKFRDVEEIKTEQVPVKNCTDIEDSRENCQPVAVPTTRVMFQLTDHALTSHPIPNCIFVYIFSCIVCERRFDFKLSIAHKTCII